MTKRLRTVKVSILMGILLMSAIPILIQTPTAEAAILPSFNSYISFSYDPSPLNEPLAIDVAVTIPITIKYQTDIPKYFRKIPFPINNYLLFGSAIGPMQKIHVEILNPPDWANIFISTPDVLVDIPIEDPDVSDSTFVEEQVNLILSPRVEAPAESYTINLQATCEPIKRLNGFSHQEGIQFTPSFIPTIQINSGISIRTVGPHESVNYQIKVKNIGNKITRVTPTLIGVDDKWTARINPPQYEILPDSENTFTFAIITPFDFGWHNEFGTFEVQFLSEVYPYQSAAASNTQSIYLVVNNHGFSTPGFEFPLMLIALACIVIMIYKKKQFKK